MKLGIESAIPARNFYFHKAPIHCLAIGEQARTEIVSTQALPTSFSKFLEKQGER